MGASQTAIQISAPSARSMEASWAVIEKGAGVMKKKSCQRYKGHDADLG